MAGSKNTGPVVERNTAHSKNLWMALGLELEEPGSREVCGSDWKVGETRGNSNQIYILQRDFWLQVT